MSLILRPPGEYVPLNERLASLGRTRKAALVTAGVLRFLAIVPLAVAIAAIMDIGLHLPAAVRAILLGACLGLTGWLFARWIRRPLREPADSLSVAYLLERRFPRFNDAVASAVAFLHTDNDPLRGAREFRRVAVIRAENLADRHDLGEVVPTGPLWQATWLFIVSTLVIFGLVLADPPRARQSLVRLFDPFGHHPWPAQTELTILSPQTLPGLLARGEAFEIRFAVRGVIPDHAMLELRYPGSPGSSSEAVALRDEQELDPKEVVRSVMLDPSRVTRDFEFRLIANDADTGWLSIAVAPPPKLVPLNGRPSPQLELTFPPYTQLSPAVLPDGTAVIEAVNGTRIRLRAATDRRVVVAVLRNQTDYPDVPSAQAMAPLAGIGATPFSPLMAGLLAESYTAEIPVPIVGPDGQILEIEFDPPLPGLYALQFTDERGLTGTRLFDLRTFPDPSPTVHLERPAVGQDALTVLPTATVTIQARAEDTVFAVRKLTLEYSIGNGPFTEILLTDVTPAGAVLPALVSPAVLPIRPQPIMIQGSRSIPVAAFTRPDGSAPTDGDSITLRAAATDWDDVTPLKTAGRSNEITLRVFAPSSFDALIQKELAGLRPELARARDIQKELADQLREFAKNVPPSGRLDVELQDDLTQVERVQRQIQSALTDPRDGARVRAERLRDLIRANDLPQTPVTERAEAVARALSRIDEEHLQIIPQQLSAAKQEADRLTPNPKAVTDPLAKAERHQREAVEGLEAALERLERWAGAGELRSDVRTVKDEVNKAAEESRRATEQVPDGMTPDKLTPAQQTELNRAAERFDQAAVEASTLIAKASRVAAEKEQQSLALKSQAAELQAAAEQAQAEAQKHPAGSDVARDAQAKAEALQAEATAFAEAGERAAAEADALRRAVAESGGQALPDDLRRAADATRQNRPGAAAAARQSANDRLDRMQNELAERRDDVDELRKKSRAAAEQVEKLANEQDELRKKIEQTGEIQDNAERAETLQNLSREQQRLREQAEQLARRLTRDGADLAAEELRRAAEQMEQNQAQLEQGNTPTDQQQDETENRLDKAQQKLNDDRGDNEEQLLRERREELLKEFQDLYERQQAALHEADRIENSAKSAKRWDRPLLASLSDLADREQTLAEEVLRFAEKNLGDLKVFDRLAKHAANEMERAAKTIINRKDDLLAEGGVYDSDLEPVTASTIRRPMQNALRRMQQILDALKPDDKQNPQTEIESGSGQGGGGGGGGGGAGAAGQPGGRSIPPLAQLKALRDWQAEINERTAAFANNHPDPAKLTDDEKTELKDLEQAQKDIAELFEQLLPLFQPQGIELP